MPRPPRPVTPVACRRLALVAAAALSFASGEAAAATYVVTGVAMSGLANPRGLSFGPDGGLYVAESGAGGNGGSVTSGSGATVFYGLSGAVSRLLGGVQETVLTGLPSLAPTGGGEATGPQDVAFGADGRLRVVIGLGGAPSIRAGLAGETDSALLGTVQTLTSTGLVTLADLAAFEAANNPTGDNVDSNPFGIVAVGSGFAVTDAGGNSVLSIAADGTISVLATLPATPNPLPVGPSDYQAVPTGLATDGAGNVLVGNLTGFPFLAGAASVISIAPDGTVSPFADGLTNLIDVAFAGGRAFALEFDSDGLFPPLGPGSTGSLYRIKPNGTKVLLLDGLVQPTGLAIGPDGAFYVAVNGNSPTDGEVLRISAVPVPAAMPLLLSALALVAALRGRRRLV